jgi:hypothetical protein
LRGVVIDRHRRAARQETFTMDEWEDPATVLLRAGLALDEPHTASERWRNFVMKLVWCDRDLTTVAAWARHLGVSRTALRESCRLVRVLPHDARDFARMLRAIWRSGHAWQPESLLNIADPRTLRKLELRAGIDGRSRRRPPTIEEFLKHQTWIARDSAALVAVRSLSLTTPASRPGSRRRGSTPVAM